jgi:hypothetical protein
MIEPSMEELILSGVVEVAGIDPKTGSFLYNFTPKLKEVMPELWNERLDFIHEEVMFFWQHGFLEVKEMEKRNPIIFLTEKAFDENEIDQLPEDKAETLQEIKRLFER